MGEDGGFRVTGGYLCGCKTEQFSIYCLNK